jgi:hypothetical protein
LRRCEWFGTRDGCGWEIEAMELPMLLRSGLSTQVPLWWYCKCAGNLPKALQLQPLHPAACPAARLAVALPPASPPTRQQILRWCQDRPNSPASSTTPKGDDSPSRSLTNDGTSVCPTTPSGTKKLLVPIWAASGTTQSGFTAADSSRPAARRGAECLSGRGAVAWEGVAGVMASDALGLVGGGCGTGAGGGCGGGLLRPRG